MSAPAGPRARRHASTPITPLRPRRSILRYLGTVMIFAFLASWIAMCASVATFRAMERRDDRHASQAAPYAPPALACPLPSTCSMVRAMLAEGASLLGGMM